MKKSIIIYIPKDFPRIFLAFFSFVIKTLLKNKQIYIVSWAKDILSIFQNNGYEVIYPSYYDFHTQDKSVNAYKLYNDLFKSVDPEYQHILSDDNLTFGYWNCIGVPASLRISKEILNELKPSLVLALPGRDGNRLGHAIVVEAKLRKISTWEPFPLLFIKLKYFKKNLILLLKYTIKIIFSQKSEISINSDNKTILLFSSSEHQRQSIYENIKDLRSNGYDIIHIPGDFNSLLKSKKAISKRMIKNINLLYILFALRDNLLVFSCGSLIKSIYSNLISNQVSENIAHAISIETAIVIRRNIHQWNLIQKMVDKWLIMLQPSATIETSPGHGMISNSMIRYANMNNIPTIWLNWARLITPNNLDYLLSQSRYAFSMGKDLKKMFDPNNFKKNPDSNFFSTDIGISSSKINSTIKIENGNIRALVIITGYAHEELGLESVYIYDEAVSWINDILSAFNQEAPSSKLLLKEHVWGDSILQSINNDYNNFEILYRYKSAENYLCDCNIVIVSYSSMMIKAVENGKIVIIYWPYKYFEYEFDLPLIKHNAVILCRSYRELINCIYRIKNDEKYLKNYLTNQKTFLNKYMSEGESISKSLKKLLKQNN